MTEYDLTNLAKLGRAYERERAAAEKTRGLLTPEIIAAAAAGVRQIDIVKASGLTRERVRQICRAAGVEQVEQHGEPPIGGSAAPVTSRSRRAPRP